MSNSPAVAPRKDTVYDGPDVHTFKPKQLPETKPASGTETVHDGEIPEFISRRFSAVEVAELQQPLTETVHEGEIPDFITRRFSASQITQVQKLQTETVYQGPIPEMFSKLGRIALDLVMPDRETIYAGPDIKVQRVENVSYADRNGSSTSSEPRKETVFDEATFTAKRADTTASRSLVTRMVQRASVRFFAVAILSLVELYLCWGNVPVMISSGIMFVTFSTVGFYTFKLNLKALLFAIGIYGATTLFMLSNAIMGDNIFLMILPLLSRAFMIYNLLRTYGLLVDLHLLEAEIY